MPLPSTARKCCWAMAVEMAPPEVPMMAAGLPGQEVLPQGRAPQSMAFFEHGRDRAAVLGGDEQQGVGAVEFGLEAGDGGRHRLFVVLVVHRQVVDLDEFGLEGVGAELRQRLRQLAVDGFAPVASRR